MIQRPPSKKLKQLYHTFELDERRAAHYGHYSWTDYLGLVGDPWWAFDSDSKADVIAFYRVNTLLEAKINAWQNK